MEEIPRTYNRYIYPGAEREKKKTKKMREWGAREDEGCETAAGPVGFALASPLKRNIYVRRSQSVMRY